MTPWTARPPGKAVNSVDLNKNDVELMLSFENVAYLGINREEYTKLCHTWTINSTQSSRPDADWVRKFSNVTEKIASFVAKSYY